MGDLTPEAKREIAEAIRIVREDRFETHVRNTLGKHKPVDPPKPNDPPKPEDPPAPPPKPEDPPIDPAKRHSAYWGELFDDES